MYVGLSGGRDGIEGRWVKHKKRFPEDLFSYEILLPCPRGTTRSELSLLEKFYIRELDCMEPMGFNLTSGGTQSTEVSEVTRKRQSEAHKGQVPHNKGKPASAETRAKQSEAGKNRARASVEARANMSAWQKGRVKGPMSEEQKLKLSQAAKERSALKRAAKAIAEAATEALLTTEIISTQDSGS